MADIKPAEVSEILKKQLEGYKTEAELEEVGTVLSVGDSIARIHGLTNVKANEMIEFANGTSNVTGNAFKDDFLTFLNQSPQNVAGGGLNATQPSKYSSVITA